MNIRGNNINFRRSHWPWFELISKEAWNEYGIDALQYTDPNKDDYIFGYWFNTDTTKSEIVMFCIKIGKYQLITEDSDSLLYYGMDACTGFNIGDGGPRNDFEYIPTGYSSGSDSFGGNATILVITQSFIAIFCI